VCTPKLPIPIFILIKRSESFLNVFSTSGGYQNREPIYCVVWEFPVDLRAIRQFAIDLVRRGASDSRKRRLSSAREFFERSVGCCNDAQSFRDGFEFCAWHGNVEFIRADAGIDAVPDAAQA
jgi:hypothetical protein